MGYQNAIVYLNASPFTIVSEERDKYLDKLAELMNAEDTIHLRYLKLYFIGMSGLGKTTLRKHLTRIYLHILVLYLLRKDNIVALTWLSAPKC